MSDWEEIFFDVDSPLETAAATLADTLRLHTRSQEAGVDVWGEPEQTGLAAPVFGTIELNDYAEPDPETDGDSSIFDDMRYVLELRLRTSDHHLQPGVALELYRRLCSQLAWRSALTSGFASLRATYDDTHGYREFPEDTLSDATHADRWR
ncbi:hypothetical protein [Actinomycetospora sp. TBRC 11914]|uniref:hypothetical protein n=1 Tax=Actinomycetospora sp. TBRC 11914 TaxID=2729387 RepID=UPI00145F0E2D|nr:hypothetical protein [Actinomycetospora sp. TBRC 11914]NMO88667.1 hypothetical protein [Actinomycetospora sp. TBRC 11914]